MVNINIPLSSLQPQDRLGVFFVRSAYHLGKELHTSTKG
jgi:hypothetical protein